MANIQEYNPQIEAAEPVGAVSPNMGQVDAIGNAIQNVGRGVDEASSAIYRRNAQRESTEAYATFSQARADAYGKVNQGMQDGSLTPETGQKIMDDYKDFVDQQSGNYGTAIGKNYFDRQSARLGSSLQQKISAGVAHVSGQQEAALMDQATQNDHAAIFAAPENFTDVLDSAYEGLEQKSTENGGPLNPTLMVKAKKQMANDYALTATRALALTSPESAQAIYNTGALSKYLDEKGMDKAQEIIHQAQSASNAQASLNDKQDKDEAAVKTDAVLRDTLAKAYKGQPGLQDLIANPDLDAEGVEKGIAIFKRAAEQNEVSNPRNQLDLYNRIYSADNAPGHIASVKQISDLVASGKITVADAQRAQSMLGTTPETKRTNASLKLVMEQAEQTLGRTPGLVPGMPSVKDPNGPGRVLQFHNDVLDAIDNQIAAQKPVRDLFDPSNSAYVGKMMDKYKPKGRDFLHQGAQDKVNGALGMDTPSSPATVQNTPGVPFEPPPPRAPQNANVRQPGESAVDFLRRKKGG